MSQATEREAAQRRLRARDGVTHLPLAPPGELAVWSYKLEVGSFDRRRWEHAASGVVTAPGGAPIVAALEACSKCEAVLHRFRDDIRGGAFACAVKEGGRYHRYRIHADYDALGNERFVVGGRIVR